MAFLEPEIKENRNLYLEVDGDRQWVRKLSFAIKICSKARRAGLDVSLIETVRLWERQPGKSWQQTDYHEYDRTHLLKY